MKKKIPNRKKHKNEEKMINDGLKYKNVKVRMLEYKMDFGSIVTKTTLSLN